MEDFPGKSALDAIHSITGNSGGEGYFSIFSRLLNFTKFISSIFISIVFRIPIKGLNS